ncbi:MAG: type IX secretion system membrane protein PorP/SprF [Bacteroidia bacterium]|nr:type IX secretion system membrane protein PorP/SprF [Bacteroidia bacterium]
MKKTAALIICIAIISAINAQQRNMFSQYMLNKYWVNPAVAGTTPYIPLSVTYKQFWTGIDDAPNVQALNGHAKLVENMGIGGTVYNYSTGPTSIQSIEGTYSYHFNVMEGAKISLGLSAMLYQNQLNKSALLLENPDDDAVNYCTDKLIVPDASFGVYFYETESKYYAGLAVHSLFNRKVNHMNNKILEQRQVRHYFLHGGYIFTFNDFKIEPSLLLKLIEAGVFQGDINVSGQYKDIVSAGISYRLGDALAVMAGVGNKRLTFGYSYDITLSNIRNASNGSHELLFIYKVGEIDTNRPKY